MAEPTADLTDFGVPDPTIPPVLQELMGDGPGGTEPAPEPSPEPQPGPSPVAPEPSAQLAARELFQQVVASTSDRGAPPSQEAQLAAENQQLKGLLGSLSHVLQERGQAAQGRLAAAAQPAAPQEDLRAMMERELSDPKVVETFRNMPPENVPVALGRMIDHYGRQMIDRELAPLRVAAQQTEEANKRNAATQIAERNFETAAGYISSHGSELEQEVLRDFNAHRGQSVLAQLIYENPLHLSSPANVVSAVAAAASWVQKAGAGLGASAPAAPNGTSTGPAPTASGRTVAARQAAGGPEEPDEVLAILNAKSRTSAIPFLQPGFKG